MKRCASVKVTAKQVHMSLICIIELFLSQFSRVANNLVGARRFDNVLQDIILQFERVHLKLKFFYLLLFFFNAIIGIGLGAECSGYRTSKK